MQISPFRSFSVLAPLLCCCGLPLIAATGSLTGLLDLTFDPKLDPLGAVWEIVPQSDGKIIIQGPFSEVEGTRRDGLARLNADGSLDATFDPGNLLISPRDIWVVALNPEGKLMVGGSFTNFGSFPANGLVRLNSDGSVDPSFRAEVEKSASIGFAATVFSITFPKDGKTVIAGDFSVVNGVTAHGVARLLNDGALDPTFDTGRAPLHSYYSTAIQPDGKILAGGLDGVFRFHADGSVDEAFASNRPAGKVFRVLALPDGRSVLAALDPFSLGSTNASIIALRPDGSLDETFPPFGTGSNNRILLDAKQRILVGGNASRGLDGYFLRLHTNGMPDRSFGLRTGHDAGRVDAFALQHDGKILITGEYEEIDGVPRRGLARIHETNSTSTIYFASTNLSILEWNTNLVVTVSRGGDIERPATVSYHTVDGTALAGTHFVLQTGTVGFAPGEESRDISIGIIDDHTPAPPTFRAFEVVLDQVSGDAVLNPQYSRAHLSIAEIDHMIGITLSPAALTISESRHYAILAVRRDGPRFNGDVLVDYSATDLTAQASRDYQATSGTLAFPGFTIRGPLQTEFEIAVPLLDNLAVDGSRTFRVALSNPRIVPSPYFLPPYRLAAVLAGNPSAEVTIADNDIRLDSPTLNTSRSPRLTSTTAISESFVLQSSTDLFEWIPLLTNEPSASLNFVDSSPATPHKFYRAVPTR